MGNAILGFSWGFCFAMGIVAYVHDTPTRLEKFSLDHGIAHYDSKTAKYTQDSLIRIDDSTIRVRHP
jgi:hypothetical protein